MSDEAQDGGFRIQGWHVLSGFVAAFAVIIGVNIYLAISAVRTFPGLEVKNSYVASQTFDVDRASQEALGWTVRADHRDGELVLAITDAAGAPVRVSEMDAVLGRATHVKEDQHPVFAFDGVHYVSPVALGPGNWNIRLTAQAQDGTIFRQRVILHVEH